MREGVSTDRAPVRTCVGCRSRSSKPLLLRMVRSDGRVVADPAADLPGRGCYVCDRGDCLDRALAQDGRAVRRSLRRVAADATVDHEGIRTAWRQAYGGASAGPIEQATPGGAQDSGVAMASPTTNMASITRES